MSGVAIMLALLSGDAALTTLTPRVRAGILPQGIELPAVGISSVGDGEEPTMARNLPVKMIRERVQVTAMTKDYPMMKQLVKAMALGRGVHSGMIAGFKVNSILSLGTNPEIPPANDGIFEQSRDFMVTFLEAN